MARHFELEIEKLKSKVLTLATMVEEAVCKAVKAVSAKDSNLGRAVKENDRLIDQMEVEIEEDCLKILALHQPVATDLRFIVAVLKLNNDLERIGDLAVSIAHRAETLSNFDGPVELFDFNGMSSKVQSMLKRCFESLVNMDLAEAKQVCADDDEVDDLNRQMFSSIIQAIKKVPSKAEGLVHLFAVARSLERIADHATNIAEDVIYMVQGDIVRHGRGL